MRPYSANGVGLRKNTESLGALHGHRGECTGNISRAASWHKLKPHAHCLGRALDLLQHSSHRALAVCTSMPEDSHARQLRRELSEQLQALGDQLRAKRRLSRCHRPTPAFARLTTSSSSTGSAIGNCNDGNAAGRLVGRAGSRLLKSDNDINLMLNQLNSDFTEPIWLVFPKFALEADIVLLRCNQAPANLRSGSESHAT